MSEPLRPCPFCGSSANVKDVGVGAFTCVACMDATYFLKKQWNNAYAWKELDKARALLAKYKSSNAELIRALHESRLRGEKDEKEKYL